MDAFTNTISQVTPEQLSQECGVEYGPALQLLKQLKTYTAILTDSSNRALQLMKCQNIVPLYTSTVYEATCDVSVRAATWLFAALFVVAFFGMLMIMFRGAYYPIDEADAKSLDYGTSEDDAELREDESGLESSAVYGNESNLESPSYDVQPTATDTVEEETEAAGDRSYQADQVYSDENDAYQMTETFSK